MAVGTQTGRSRKLRSWRILLMAIAISSIVVGLVTRIFESSASATPSASSQCSKAIRQNMDRDADHWVAPTACTAGFHIVVSFPIPARAKRLVPSILFATSLYNRPPPSSSALLIA